MTQNSTQSSPQGSPLLDTHSLVLMLLEQLAVTRASDEEKNDQTREANQYLEERLLNYLTMLRRRNLIHAYEFLVPPNGKGIGWYWRHQKVKSQDHINWHGPFASRKAAIEDRMKQKGAPRTPLDILERDIFTT